MVARGYLFSERKVSVMTSLKDFILHEFEVESKKTFTPFPFVVQIQLQNAFRAGWGATSELFTYSNESEKNQKRAIAKARHFELTGKPYEPVAGIVLTALFAKTCLYPEKHMDRDWQQFVDMRHSETNRKKLEADIGLAIEGELPTDLFIKGIVANDLFEFNKAYWARLIQVTDNHAEALVKAGKSDAKMYKAKDGTEKQSQRRIYIIEKIYKSEIEARVEADELKAGADGQVTSSKSYSATAKANYPDLSILEAQQDDIVVWLNKAQQGTPYNNDATNFPLPVPLTPPNVKKYIANIFLIEPEDIDFFLPF